MKIIRGANLLDATEKVIVHQVNCQSVMGGGVALAIRNKYPKHYMDYMNDERTPEEKLGSVVSSFINEKRVVVGIYGQLEFSNRSICNTSYEAVGNALATVCKACTSVNENKIAIPYLMSCDLAGGDWNIIKNILTTMEERYNVEFICYDLFNKSED